MSAHACTGPGIIPPTLSAPADLKDRFPEKNGTVVEMTKKSDAVAAVIEVEVRERTVGIEETGAVNETVIPSPAIGGIVTAETGEMAVRDATESETAVGATETVRETATGKEIAMVTAEGREVMIWTRTYGILRERNRASWTTHPHLRVLCRLSRETVLAAECETAQRNPGTGVGMTAAA
jgi:hypothetical protein